MNTLDRIISYFSPQAAAKREAYRAHMRLLGERKYEGASTSDRLKLWGTSDSSANKEVQGAASSLRKRARDLRRNNPYAARAVQVITTNTVGTGIKPNFKVKNKQVLSTIKDQWEKWAENSTDCDFDGCHNLLGIQNIVMDSVIESGEVFIVRNRVPKSRTSSVPLKLQILESDYLPHMKHDDMVFTNKVQKGNQIKQGIEFDSSGRRVAYHFYKNHPGEEVANQETMRVPADRVIHVYRKQRPGQIRGVSWLHSVMIRMKDLDTFQDATLRKQQVSACFSAFIYNSTGEPLANTYSSKKEWELLEKLDTGTIETLPPGFDVKFAEPPSTSDYPNFVKTELMSIAAGLGITYEALTQDYGNVNFSSARMGFLEFQRNIKRWQNEIMIVQFLNPVFNWFLDAIQFSAPQNINPERIFANWTTPAREMIDPSKEVPAARDAVKAGFKTVSEVLRQQGYNSSDVFQERKEELETLKEMGIPTDSDPSMGTNQNQGSGQNEETQTSNED